ncbi:MAG: histidine kinase/response regulator receiver protein [Verrucomicrobiales bacterium]|nr:histidine kinase/response regulator receiver protein [Verrucomicrobiales bacterium]
MNSTTPSKATKWLVVDNDEGLLWLLAHIVESLTGSEVVCCTSGREAIEVLRYSARDFAGVITDLDMPGMQGDQLLIRVRALCPSLKVFLSSGNLDWNENRALASGFEGFLPKPFTVVEVREILDRVHQAMSFCAA